MKKDKSIKEDLQKEEDITTEESLENEEKENELDQLKAENAEFKEQVLRALAEAENVRKRAERDKDDMRKYGIASFARDFLSIQDNFQRALEGIAKEPEILQNCDEKIKSFVLGIEMISKELLSLFEKHGIKEIDPCGDPFDPTYHQAMLEIEDSTKEPGTVVQVFQKGYLLQDRLLRPALVVVSKKPAEAK